MNITIVGAGNIGTQFAVHCAEKGHNVILFSSKPEKINKTLSIVNENGQTIHSGQISSATSEPVKAFSTADLIFITLPAFCIEDCAEKIYPYAKPGVIVCIVPGTGGGECALKKIIDKGAIICGLQRVPSVARLEEYGKTVRATGYRDELFVASIPSEFSEKCSEIIGNIFDIKCSPISCYLNITLTPSNPILHTTRLRTLFEDYKKGITYTSVPLFYEGWSDESSELLFLCDDEVQLICKTLPFDLCGVKSLKVHYESPTPKLLTEKIKSIKGFKGLTSPVVKLDDGYIPDLSSRYFTADFSYGLEILVQIAEMAGVCVPNMKATLDWYYGIAESDKKFSFSRFGITNFDEFIDFYKT